MKKIVVLLLIVVLSININGKTHVYTCSDWALSDWMSAHLALALLEERNRNLLFTLLDNQNNRLVVVMSLSPCLLYTSGYILDIAPHRCGEGV